MVRIHKTWTQQLIVLLLRFILSTINFGLNDMETYSCRTELKISANIMYRTRQSSSAASIKVMAYQNKLLQSILTKSWTCENIVQTGTQTNNQRPSTLSSMMLPLSASTEAHNRVWLFDHTCWIAMSKATVTYNESTCNMSTCSDNSNTGNKLHATLLQTVHFMPVKLKRKHGTCWASGY